MGEVNHYVTYVLTSIAIAYTGALHLEVRFLRKIISELLHQCQECPRVLPSAIQNMFTNITKKTAKVKG